MFKKFIITSVLLTYCLLAKAQQYHFIYIQSEDKQPFYVVLNGKQYNSTITGYSIIPKLTQGQYNIEVNAIKNRTVTRANFACSIHERDMGYLLKSIEGKGFTLVDLQTQQSIMPTQTTTGSTINNTNNFGDMLADVANDPSLKNKNISNNTNAVNNTMATIPIALNNNGHTSVVKINENNIDETAVYTYIDVQKNGKIDTIRIAIAKNKIDTNAVVTKTIIKKDSLTVKDTNKIAKIIPAKDSTITLSSTQQNKTSPVYNFSCRALAGMEEVERLKRSFVQEASEEDMIVLAKRQFEKKCFTTAQIKSLGRLFLSDATRFQFFKAAYPFIYDIDQASSLQQQLADTYYISLFQSLLKK